MQDPVSAMIGDCLWHNTILVGSALMWWQRTLGEHSDGAEEAAEAVEWVHLEDAVNFASILLGLMGWPAWVSGEALGSP